MSDDYLTLTTFEPGTKAKAQEVNANFTALKTALEAKASKEGSPTQTFLVANAANDSHAVNKRQLNELSEDLVTEIKKAYPSFCARSGSTTGGEADLFTYTGLVITPKIGGAYANLVISNYKGEQTVISGASAFSLAGYADGTYNIFIKSDATITAVNNTIYKQKARPSMTVGDIWLDISVEPLRCVECTSLSDIEFLGVPIGQVVVASGAISSITSFPFNKNGYNAANDKVSVNADNLTAVGKSAVISLCVPSYINGVGKNIGTTYYADKALMATITHGNSSWGYLQVSKNSDMSSSYIIAHIRTNAGEAWFTMQAVIPAGYYYKAAGVSVLTVYPMKGEL